MNGLVRFDAAHTDYVVKCVGRGVLFGLSAEEDELIATLADYFWTHR